MNRQNLRNNALSRSPHPLSFAPSTRQSKSRPMKDADTTQQDFYETFLNSQIEQLQNNIDDLDLEYVTLTRQAMERSEQVNALETEVASLIESTRSASADSLEYEKLTGVVRSSINKLNAARSHYSQATVSKNERLKRLREFQAQLEEREGLLRQHKSKSAEEKAERSERKLKSAMGEK